MYSRAWSYKGFGINVNKMFVTVFNIIVVVASVIAYFFPHITNVILKVVGSNVGIMGVMICTSETLWLLKNRKLNEARFGPVRLLDLVSFMVGVAVTGLYWVTGGMWIVNDVLAVCTIIASIKILKIRTLNDGMFMLYSLLVIELVMGLFIHYVIKKSYNNLVIQLFESPLVVAFPSITPELYRRCAWIPVTNILFPGLFISYLRRFDKSRGTFLYLIIGYVSFYFGSLIWMIIDMSTKHALPLAIISDPILTIAVVMFAHKRNELKTLWSGQFFDPEMPDITEQVLLNNRSSTTTNNNYIAFNDITEDLKIDR